MYTGYYDLTGCLSFLLLSWADDRKIIRIFIKTEC